MAARTIEICVFLTHYWKQNYKVTATAQKVRGMESKVIIRSYSIAYR
jgi:hypothetical protein